MNPSLIVISFLFCLFASCRTDSSVTSYLSLENVRLESVKADTFPIPELQNPAAMYECGQWIIFPHSESTAEAPLYIYRKDNLKMAGKWGSFGRGPDEIYDCNFYYFEKTDSSFFLNTNNVYETEFIFRNDTVCRGPQQLIAPFPMNNLIKINDSLFFFENRLKEKEYSIYNRNSRHILKQFSPYPLSKEIGEREDDRDNLCVKSCVINPEKSLICAFYENLPLIRLYDTAGNLLKEVRLKNWPRKIDIRDYEKRKSILYFSYPYAADTSIYVQFFNQPLDEYHRLTQIEIQQWNWDLALKRRFLIPAYFDIFCMDSKAGILFGVNKKEENVHFVKAFLGQALAQDQGVSTN